MTPSIRTASVRASLAPAGLRVSVLLSLVAVLPINGEVGAP